MLRQLLAVVSSPLLLLSKYRVRQLLLFGTNTRNQIMIWRKLTNYAYFFFSFSVAFRGRVSWSLPRAGLQPTIFLCVIDKKCARNSFHWASRCDMWAPSLYRPESAQMKPWSSSLGESTLHALQWWHSAFSTSTQCIWSDNSAQSWSNYTPGFI